MQRSATSDHTESSASSREDSKSENTQKSASSREKSKLTQSENKTSSLSKRNHSLFYESKEAVVDTEYKNQDEFDIFNDTIEGYNDTITKSKNQKKFTSKNDFCPDESIKNDISQPDSSNDSCTDNEFLLVEAQTFLFHVLGDNPKAKKKFLKLDEEEKEEIRNIWNKLYPIKLEANYSFEDLKKTLDLIVECMDKQDTNLEERLDYIKKNLDKLFKRKDERIKHIYLMFFEYLRKNYKDEKINEQILKKFKEANCKIKIEKNDEETVLFYLWLFYETFFKPDIDHNLFLDICLERNLKNSKNMKNNQNTKKKKIRCRKNYCDSLRLLIKKEKFAKEIFLWFLDFKCIKMALKKIKKKLFKEKEIVEKNADSKDKSKSYLVWPLQFYQKCIELTRDEFDLDKNQFEKKYKYLEENKKKIKSKQNEGNK